MNVARSKNVYLQLGVLATAIITVTLTPSAQRQTQSQPGRVPSIRFFDVHTGFAIEPDEVVIDDTPTTRSIPDRRVGAFTLQGGRHHVIARAKGYRDADTDLTLADTGVQPVAVFMSPTQLPAELNSAYVTQLRRDDATAFIGFLSDSETGQPLANVIVRTTDRGLQTRTNARGFFAMYVQTVDDPQRVQLTGLAFEAAGYSAEVHQNVELGAGDVKTYRLTLTPGRDTHVVDERKLHRQEGQEQVSATPEPTSMPQASAQPQAVTIPGSIRIGTNCNNGPKSCTKVIVYPFEEYLTRVLPAEWTASWNDDSLKAGAVAARTYSLWHIKNPLTGTYDICDYKDCQVFSQNASTSSYTDAAVASTSGTILTDQNGNVVRAEFAGENNNHGCGQGTSGDNSSAGPCIQDSVCLSAPTFGHGRGMCQSGSHRWASALIWGSPKDKPSGLAKQDWKWILNHYYGPVKYKIATASTVSGGTLQVAATLNGSNWTGTVSCSITGGVNTAISRVPATVPLLAGSYGASCTSGPAALNSVSPTSVTVTTGATKTITLNFLQESVSAPTLSGPAAGTVGNSYSFSAKGAASSLGSALTYDFEWGDGAKSSVASLSASHAWSKSGAFSVKVRVHVTSTPSIVSGYSNTATIQLTAPLGGSCAAQPNPAKLNATVTWQAKAQGGSGTYSYGWYNGKTTTSYTSSYPSARSVSNYVDISDSKTGAKIRASCSLTVK